LIEMKTLALYSIKGGVGKTATAVNLAYLAANEGKSTLLCDLDAQGSASFYFRVRPSKKFSGRKFLKGGKPIEKAIKGSDYEGLDLLPASKSFRNLDLRLDDLKRSRMARRAGVQRIASPIGEGSQTRIFVSEFSLCTDLIFSRASYRRLAP